MPEDENDSTLRHTCSGALIVVYKEDTRELRAALAAEGIQAEEVKGPYTDKQLRYSAVMQALVNHQNAWRIAADRAKPTVILEPDFVPVRGFGGLPIPVPAGKGETSISYLYSVGPEVWDLATPAVARAHCGSVVALVVPPAVARLLLRFFEEEIAANAAGGYRPWDSGLGYWLLERRIESYMPYRHYGEHGGIGNPEHAIFGLGRNHRADAIAGPLAFLPLYARGRRWRFWRGRVRGRIWGVLRLLTGRLMQLHDLRRAHGHRAALMRFTVGRLFVGTPPTGRKRTHEPPIGP